MQVIKKISFRNIILYIGSLDCSYIALNWSEEKINLIAKDGRNLSKRELITIFGRNGQAEAASSWVPLYFSMDLAAMTNGVSIN